LLRTVCKEISPLTNKSRFALFLSNLWTSLLPVKIDLSEPIEGADIGLKVIVNNRRNWSLEKQTIHEIMETLSQYDLIPSLEWEFLPVDNSPLNRELP